eukprot:GHVR01034125.1.p2 GENE.GHVR01034125.1~~GHVR01034125.1.p2  ORF type:complete len:122 (-),score=14.15 GHVR01034125.1:1770-2135(-)
MEDEGDRLLFAQEHEKCKEHYAKRIENGEKTSVVYFKKANAHYECGELNSAYENALKSLELDYKIIDKLDKENCLKVFKIHQKSSKIMSKNDDFINAEKGINKTLEAISDDDWLTKSKQLK